MKNKVFSLTIILTILAATYFVPILILFYVFCGALDLGRNKTLTWNDAKVYLFGPDFIVWVMSPLNLFADLLTWSSPRHLALEELPEDCQDEIKTVLDSFDHEEITKQLEEKVADQKKGMIFFKWYGRNLETFIDNETFQRQYKYINTIGISIFNKHSSTKRHFGPIRFTHRVLYNLNPIKHDQIYLEVDGYRHYWHDNQLLIFDDSYVHQSLNESDNIRYVVFMDMVRASRYFYPILNLMTKVVGFLVLNLRSRFYSAWAVIK